MVHSPNDALQTHKVRSKLTVEQKSLKNSEILEKLSPGEGGGYWGGRPLWDNAAYRMSFCAPAVKRIRQMGRKGGLLARMADSLMLHWHVGQAMPVGDGAVSATRQLSSVAPTIGRMRQWDGWPAGPTDGGHWVHVRLYVILCRMYPNRQQASKQENLEKLGLGEGES